MNLTHFSNSNTNSVINFYNEFENKGFVTFAYTEKDIQTKELLKTNMTYFEVEKSITAQKQL